jgi:all-trans-retinol dehydrogenase (NAD+)
MSNRTSLLPSLRTIRQKGVPLAGARVLVTGGGSGMGRLMALGAARAGAEVWVWDLSAERANSVRDEILAVDGRVHADAVDVSDLDSVNAAAKRAEGIDVLINNAGVVGGRLLLEESPQAIERTLDVNLKSLFWVTRAFLPGMVARRHGFVVTMASAAGLIAGSRMSDYAASKFGAVGFNEALRNELRAAGAGVGTLVVAPFYTKTGMFEGTKTRFPLLLPLLEPEAVAGKVLRGIERGQKQIICPPFVRTTALLRLLPVGVLDWTADLFGINSSMDDFSGRPSDRV